MPESTRPAPSPSAASSLRPEGRSLRRRRAPLSSLVGVLALVLLPGMAFSQQVAAVDTPARSAGAEDTAEEDADRRMEAVRAPIPRPEVDGDLGDPAWADAPVATDFVQYEPDPGTEPSQRTEVRVLYTSDAVYVGARMFDTHPDSILARLSRRDESAVADRFMVGFDSYHDRRTAFVFGVTAAGVQSDALLYDDTNEDQNWDAVWESAVEIDSAGWVAEMRIPLSQLRFSVPEDTARGDTWGLNFQREIARLDETAQWSPFPADGSRMVSAFGTLTGLKRL
ncbi:MAG: carbohydrate binding family 9 domain-containing protein, partial [Candidatus Palauibacterales bacterium]|nr:carbohydrate binding family 9 domain-containing protein [Candidatus Palauibacterales bacterium]